MTVTVETLDKLERKITLSLPVDSIQTEVQNRLKRLARTVKMDGFRPGKVPMNVVAQRYGYSVQYEVMNDKVGEAFNAAANEAQLRVAGQPRISEKEGAPDGQVQFDAVFEVYPEVKIADLSAARIERVSAEVTEEAIDRTIEILRKQRRSFAQRAQDAAAQEGDRATIDFEGKIDGEPFAGGKAEDFQFLIGEGQMLKEFEEAVKGMKAGESKTFPSISRPTTTGKRWPVSRPTSWLRSRKSRRPTCLRSMRPSPVPSASRMHQCRLCVQTFERTSSASSSFAWWPVTRRP